MIAGFWFAFGTGILAGVGLTLALLGLAAVLVRRRLGLFPPELPAGHADPGPAYPRPSLLDRPPREEPPREP